MGMASPDCLWPRNLGAALGTASFIWSRQHPWEGGLSETAGALSRVAQLVSGKSGLSHGPCACPSWSLGPFSCVPAGLSAATPSSAPWAFSALGKRQSRGSAASGFRAARLPPLNLRPLPGPKHPKWGLRALSVILSINTCSLNSSLELTWLGDTQGTNMSKIHPQGAFNLVEETGSPSSSNSVASALERCEQEATGAQRRGPRPDRDSGRPPGGGETAESQRMSKSSLKGMTIRSGGLPEQRLKGRNRSLNCSLVSRS